MISDSITSTSSSRGLRYAILLFEWLLEPGLSGSVFKCIVSEGVVGAKTTRFFILGGIFYTTASIGGKGVSSIGDVSGSNIVFLID